MGWPEAWIELGPGKVAWTEGLSSRWCQVKFWLSLLARIRHLVAKCGEEDKSVPFGTPALIEMCFHVNLQVQLCSSILVETQLLSQN